LIVSHCQTGLTLHMLMYDEPRFSTVIPAKNEADNLANLLAEIAAVLAGERFEVVVVDDGSNDATGDVLQRLSREHPFLRHLTHDQSCGKSAALLTGVRAARGALIATMDADGQNDPRYLAPLLALAIEPNVGISVGQRLKHAHSPLKQFVSRLANGIRACLLKDRTRDTACGLKAFRKEVFLSLPYFDNMHRFLPALVMREGLEVRHLDVIDRERWHGQSKYGVIDRAAASLVDLLGVWWLIRRRGNASACPKSCAHRAATTSVPR
jgi:dolichol-phosphate mannosyltransferase